MKIFYEGANPYLLGAFVLIIILQFILMTPQLNVRLAFFCAESAILTAAMIILSIFWVALWGILCAVMCAFYTAGSAIHLSRGKKTVKEAVTMRKGRAEK